jgi:predicted transcriptional regulator
MGGYKSGTLLMRWRKRKALSQVRLAKTIGVSQSYLSDVESGRKPITPQIMDALNLQRLLSAQVSREMSRVAAEDHGWRCWE